MSPLGSPNRGQTRAPWKEMTARRSLPCSHEAGHAGPHEAEDRIAEWPNTSPAEASRLIIEERQAHGRASRRLRLWGSGKVRAREVLEAVREWEGIATKLEEAGK
jgi:hypothetical protein